MKYFKFLIISINSNLFLDRKYIKDWNLIKAFESCIISKVYVKGSFEGNMPIWFKEGVKSWKLTVGSFVGITCRGVYYYTQL